MRLKLISYRYMIVIRVYELNKEWRNCCLVHFFLSFNLSIPSSLNTSLEGDYLKYNQISCNSHPFPYNSHPSPLGTAKFLLLELLILWDDQIHASNFYGVTKFKRWDTFWLLLKIYKFFALDNTPQHLMISITSYYMEAEVWDGFRKRKDAQIGWNLYVAYKISFESQSLKHQWRLPFKNTLLLWVIQWSLKIAKFMLRQMALLMWSRMKKRA